MKNLLLIFAIILALGCKKDNDDDTTVYRWTRDLYENRVSQPNRWNSADRNTSVSVRTTNNIFRKRTIVHLTKYKKNKQQDSIYNTSGGKYSYVYKKLNKIRNSH